MSEILAQDLFFIYYRNNLPQSHKDLYQLVQYIDT